MGEMRREWNKNSSVIKAAARPSEAPGRLSARASWPRVCVRVQARGTPFAATAGAHQFGGDDKIDQIWPPHAPRLWRRPNAPLALLGDARRGSMATTNEGGAKSGRRLRGPEAERSSPGARFRRLLEGAEWPRGVSGGAHLANAVS